MLVLEQFLLFNSRFLLRLPHGNQDKVPHTSVRVEGVFLEPEHHFYELLQLFVVEAGDLQFGEELL
jgi:hypothetical protein